MKSKPKRIIALLLLFVTITGLVVTLGENVLCAGELPGAHEKTTASPSHDPEQTHDSNCPCAPSSSHIPIDHFCVGDFGGPTHAPLPSTAITFPHSRSFTRLYPVEITRHIPEVYLSLFVPPDSAII